MVELTMNNLSDTRQLLTAELEKTKATDKEIARAKLLLEEIFIRLKTGMGNLPDFSVKVDLKIRFGEVNLRLSARGEEYNPIVTLTEQSPDDEDAYRLIILKAFRDKMNFVRKNGENIVTITVHEKSSRSKQLIYTLCGLALGIVCGLAMQFGLDAETIAIINTEIINPVRHVFLNALQMMVAPVTFLAIISGITNMSDAVDIGKVGSKLIFSSIVMLAPVTLLSLGFAFVVFSGDLSSMQSAIQTSGETAESIQYGSLKDMIFDIVPNNLVEPLKGQKILQVLFLAIFFGIVLNRMGEKARGATETLDFLFKFTIGVLKIIVKAIPLIVFISMASILANTGIDSLLTFSRLFGGIIVGILLVWLVNALTTLLLGKISPIHFMKKLIAYAPVPFTLSNASARLPLDMQFCTEKLGVDPKIVSFLIPVGAQLNKTGHGVFFPLVTVMMMNVYQIEVTANLLITLYFSLVIMAMAKPSIPCGGIICLSYLFLTVGVPPESVAIILCIDPIATMFNAICNASTNITSTFILANNFGLIDKEKYLAN
ncbi:MAG: dicarboxylate/amino acid:cation symporter [Selenomonadaceae bacterium]|nr:dicarboxylate/amino acid:cation symporter [Selenomonadaceae bacterium]